MATKAKATAAQAAQPPADIPVPRSILTQFVSLMDALESADTIYKPCQAALFRTFAQSVYTAAGMKAAADQARQALAADGS